MFKNCSATEWMCGICMAASLAFLDKIHQSCLSFSTNANEHITKFMYSFLIKQICCIYCVSSVLDHKHIKKNKIYNKNSIYIKGKQKDKFLGFFKKFK